MSVDKLTREVELLVERLEDFVDKALTSHRDFCEKFKTKEYTVEKCTRDLARALLVVARGYVERNIYPRIALLVAKHKITIPELSERAEKALLKLREVARAK
jgi:hypothetical protein